MTPPSWMSIMDDTTISGNEDGDEEDAELCEDEESGAKRNSGAKSNLQLHRRGHNWPGKLKQKTNDEFKKRVYIFPKVGCLHHDPSRALEDLTAIKKHFSGKHSGKKKFGCDKCKKKFAVHGDWKAHNKICATKEYICECGTTFSK
ncbi:zinc finger protein GAI-ASSOCIATED FACTOR 1-like [Apium graveolens]|uniref:zinc finger protein GAI-ASSOCIATED FACTOR 1-like n=1 Tax=Apium graveolens TaxID=4045 RepID=UPI003D78CA18